MTTGGGGGGVGGAEPINGVDTEVHEELKEVSLAHQHHVYVVVYAVVYVVVYVGRNYAYCPSDQT